MEVKKLPGWLYHSKHEPRVFTGQAEYDAALEDGWVDSPAKIEEDIDPEPSEIPNDIAAMSRDALTAFALERFNWTLPRNVKLDELKRQIAAKLAE